MAETHRSALPLQAKGARYDQGAASETNSLQRDW